MAEGVFHGLSEAGKIQLPNKQVIANWYRKYTIV